MLDFYSWHILKLNGEKLENQPYLKQKKKLETLLKPVNRLHYTVHRFDLADFFLEEREKEGEGLILKNPDSGYERQRSYNWLKLKNWRFKTCQVAGYTQGTGDRKYFFGSLVLQDSRGEYVGRVGSGFNGWDLRKLKDLFARTPESSKPFGIDKEYTAVDLDLEVVVKYYQVTDDGILRFPVFEHTLN